MISDCSVTSCPVEHSNVASCLVENGDISSCESSTSEDLGDGNITVSNNECVFETGVTGGSVTEVDSKVTVCDTEVVSVASIGYQHDSSSSDYIALRDNAVSIVSNESVLQTCTSSVDACQVLYNDNMIELNCASSHLNVANDAFISGTFISGTCDRDGVTDWPNQEYPNVIACSTFEYE